MKITEDRKEDTVGSDVCTVLVPMFGSNTVTVLREEEAYSLLSLVSDCGGLLGLFIGFNFLIFWDSVVWATRNIRAQPFCRGGFFMRRSR